MSDISLINNNENEFKEEHRLAIILVALRLPDLIIGLAAGIMSGSLIVWMEFVETASIIIPGTILIILSAKLSKNLKYKFNYGTGKVEAITALCCEMFDIAGLICIIILSIRELTLRPEREEYLLIAIALICIETIIDFFLLRKQKNLMDRSDSRLLHSAHLSSQKEVCFDLIALVVLIISFIFRRELWVVYLSPILCLIIAIPFIIVVSRHCSESIQELTDLTLDEESQLKLMRILAKYYYEYVDFVDLRSRKSGNQIYVDIELIFNPEKTYAEIQQTAGSITSEIQKELPNCNVNIVI